MRYLILILFINIVNINLFAQNLTDSINPNTKFRKNAVFVEIGGSSLQGFSINYNRTFIKKGKNLLNGSIGTGLNFFSAKEFWPVYTARLSVSINQVEIGIDIISIIDRIINGKDAFLGIPILGFKYQKKFLFRASFTPLLMLEGEEWDGLPCCCGMCFLPFFGLSFGYCF